MKKTAIILLCCTILCALHLHAQSTETPTHLVIESIPGGEYDFSILLRDKPKIYFLNNSKGEIHIATSENTYVTWASWLVRMYYKTEQIAGDANINEINDLIERQGDQLCFSTTKPNTHISIVDIKGNIILSQVIDSGNYYYPLTDLIPGTYIAKINDSTIKFLKR